MVAEQPSELYPYDPVTSRLQMDPSATSENNQSVGYVDEVTAAGQSFLGSYVDNVDPSQSTNSQNHVISTISCQVGVSSDLDGEQTLCDRSSDLVTKSPPEVYISFQSDEDGTECAPTSYVDPYTSEYTDTVSSDDSTKFLLPPNVKVESVNDHRAEGSESHETENMLKDMADCYEDKGYTNTVSSNASSTKPLLNKTESIWSFAKEFEIPPPVIGLIDHPGFMSSQRDLSSNSNISFACQKALKYLQDERVASSLLLPGSVKDISQSPAGNGKDFDNIDHNIVPSGRHTRNLMALGVCNLMVFIACGSLRNLQSSINHEGGVGVTSLAVGCMGFVVGSIFSPFFVQNFDPYRCIIASLLPHAIQIAANYYPAMWLMVPVSLIQGLSAAILWNAMSTYVTFLAKGYSEKRKVDYEHVLSRYFGIFCLMYQMYMIFGNLIASLVLTYANAAAAPSSNATSANDSIDLRALDGLNTTGEPLSSIDVGSVILNTASPSDISSSPSTGDVLNSSQLSFCGANYCHHYTIQNSGSDVSDFARYLLFGIYIGCIFVALVICLFLLEPLNKNLFSSTVLTCGMVKTQVISLGKFIFNRKFLLLCPLLLFSSMEQGFATAEITKAFVTCPIGVHMVGYTMICMGVSASASAYLSGWLNKLMGRSLLFGLAGVINLGILAFMAVWQPTPDSIIILLVLIGIWGFADGIWLAQSNSLMGVLFPNQFEEAFTGLRIMQGMGSTLTFAYAQSFCMASKVYIMGCVVTVGMALYLVSEYLLKKEQHRKTVTETVYSPPGEV